MRAPFISFLHKTTYGLMLFLCGILMGGGAAFAQGEHEHVNAKDPVSTKGLVVDPHDHGKSHDHGDTKDPVSPPTAATVPASPPSATASPPRRPGPTGRVWFT